MLTLPKTETLEARPYIYVPFTVTMNQMQKPAQEGFPKVFEYLERHGLTPTSAAFYNYRRIDMSDTLEVEAGVAVEAPGPDDDTVRSGILPGGRFVEVDWHGHPDQLMTVTGMLIGWLKESRQELDVEEKADGDHFACRLEIYESNPGDEPDMDKWVTVLEFKLAD